MIFLSGPWERASRNRNEPTVAECTRLKFPFKDAGAIELTRVPWKTTQPLARLVAAPAEAFALNPAPAQLRVPLDAMAMLGVQRGPWGETYPAPLPRPLEDSGPVAGTLIVDPDQPTDEAKRQFRHFATAVGMAKPGDTIAIRSNKTLELPPVELNNPDVRLTIQAADGFHPTLQLDPDAAKPHAALLTVYDGAVTFKNLHFHLKPGKSDKAKTRAVAAVVGSGQCSFQNCAATLEEGNGVQLALAAIALDPDAAAPETVPRIRIKQTFIRGKGDVVSVRGSRPFDLEIDTTLAALDGSVVSVLGLAKDAHVSPLTQMTFRKVTACLNDAFLEIRAADGDRKAGGLTPAQVRCDDCLFVATGEKPFVLAVGVDGDVLTKQLLAWEGRGNVYGNYGKMLHLELPAAMTTMMPMMPADLTAKGWLAFTHEPEDSFARVTLARPPTADRPFAAAQPGDFQAKFADMKRGDTAECGAALKQLPQIDEE